MRQPEMAKGVHKVTTRGKDYWYAWRGGPRIHAEFGTTKFDQELKRLQSAVGKAPRELSKLPTAQSHPRSRLDANKHPGLTHLYRHYGFDGKLLYVGITKSTLGRWGEHTRRGDRRSIWTDEVALITVDHYPTREDAEAAEAAVILAERPTFNRVVRIAKKLAA